MTRHAPWQRPRIDPDTANQPDAQMIDNTEISSGLYDKIFVYYPRGLQTGGPEALHQLVGSLRALGQHAYLVPLPGTEGNPRVLEYERYEAPERDSVEDSTRNAIVAPEGYYPVLGTARKAVRFCWWLSIDNSPVFRRERLAMDMRTFGNCTPWDRIENRAKQRASSLWRAARGQNRLLYTVNHLVQSQYAWAYLYSKLNIVSTVLSDYTPIAITDRTILPASQRDRTILYNPKKGLELTSKVASAYGRADFRPLVDMSRSQVLDALASGTVYLDLGNHPGKDRMPREAALMGCITVVGRRGSAAFTADVPLPARHKVQLQCSDPIRAVIAVLDSAFAAPDEYQQRQRPYVEMIKGEERRFLDEARTVFVKGELGSDTSGIQVTEQLKTHAY